MFYGGGLLVPRLTPRLEGHPLLAVRNCLFSIFNIKKNTDDLLDASKEVDLEVNRQKTKYMLMSRSQKIGQKHSIKIANRSFEDVAKFKVQKYAGID
jgi:hypothetical protein